MRILIEHPEAVSGAWPPGFVGLGDYASFSQAGTAGRYTIFAADAMTAIRNATANLSQLERLTWDSFIANMGRLGYPEAETRAFLSVAEFLIPERYRARLHVRAAPAPAPAPSPPKAPPPAARPAEAAGQRRGLPTWAAWTFGTLGVGAAVVTVATLARRRRRS